MKIEMTEETYGFEITLTPESIQEAALLTRMGINRVKEVIYADTYVNSEHQFRTHICIKNRRQPESVIPQA